MKIQDIVLQINQGLVSLGKYAPGRIHDSEIQLALDVELGSIFNEVIKNKEVETSSFTTSLLNDLKDTQIEKVYTNSIDYFVYNWPDNCSTILKASIIITELKDVSSTLLTIGRYYKPSPQAKINSIWVTEVTQAREEGFNGTVKEVVYHKFPIRLTPSEKIDSLRDSPFYKSKFTSPLGELEAKTLKVYLDECIPYGIEYSFYRNPILFSPLKGSDNSPYSEIVNNELIKLVIKNIKQRQ